MVGVVIALAKNYAGIQKSNGNTKYIKSKTLSYKNTLKDN